MVLHHPFSQDRAATAHNPGDTITGQRNILDEHACMNRHVVDPLLSLFFDYLKHDAEVQIFNPAYPV